MAGVLETIKRVLPGIFLGLILGAEEGCDSRGRPGDAPFVGY